MVSTPSSTPEGTSAKAAPDMLKTNIAMRRTAIILMRFMGFLLSLFG
jgi:hypothetical protein